MAINVARFGLSLQLHQLQEQNKPIRVGLVGCGEMGTDFLARISLMEGIKVCAIASRTPKRIFENAALALGSSSILQEIENETALQTAIEQNKIAATGDFNLLLKNEQIDIIVDATGYPEAGAQIGYKTLNQGKHLVMMNVEADVTIGPYLNHLAQKNNLIYSLGAGDEPSACMEIIEFLSSMGHQIVAAGKGKNNPLHFDATPDDYQEEAQKRNMNPRMLVEFIDGSKTMVEMAALANATGLIPDCPGMHGPKANLQELNKIFIPKEDGGILQNLGVVDYTIGQGVSPGVFVIAKMDHPRIQERMEDLKMGKGPYFTFHRPYHLTAMEVPLTCARIMLNKKADMQPMKMPVAEVCALAKKDLYPGDKLDFMGLYTYRAWTMTQKEAKQQQAIPCGLLENAEIIAPIEKNELITQKNVRINETQWIAKLRREQEKLIMGEQK